MRRKNLALRTALIPIKAATRHFVETDDRAALAISRAAVSAEADNFAKPPTAALITLISVPVAVMS